MSVGAEDVDNNIEIENKVESLEFLNADKDENRLTNTKNMKNYSDYNLLFEQETIMLGDGFHSPTTTTKSRFDTHPRVLIYFLISASSLGVNFSYFAQIWLVIISIIIHLSVLSFGVFLKWQQQNGKKNAEKLKFQYSLRRSKQISAFSGDEQVKKLASLSPQEVQSPKYDQHFKHTYTNAMNWMFRVSNTYSTVPRWLSWVLPGAMLFGEFLLLIILSVWGTEVAPGQYCKNGYPNDTDPDFETGGCFIQKEIGLFLVLGALLGIIASLGSLYDISPQSMKSIELARKRIIKLFNHNPFNDDYFIQIKSERKRLVIPFWKKGPFGLTFGIILVWSSHVVYWEPRLVTRVEEHVAAVIVLFIFEFIGFMFTSYCIVATMFTIKNVYKDYWIIMQTLARPIHIKSMDDIRSWTEIRKFYMNYHMVIYFGCANGIVISYIVVEFICVFIGIYWRFFDVLHIASVGTLSVAVGGLVFTLNLLHILAFCADISDSRKLHVSMLQQEKQKLLWELRDNKNDNNNDNNNDNFSKVRAHYIDDICKHITEYDKSPKILGIPMTWSLYNIMLVYGVSGLVSIISATLLE